MTTSPVIKNISEKKFSPSQGEDSSYEYELWIKEAFPEITEQEWEDWGWQMQHRFRTREALSEFIPLTQEEKDGIEHCGQKLTMAIPPYFASLIDPQDPQCPIRRQCVPTSRELVTAPEEMRDPCGEEKHSPARGLVHRYPDRVLFLVSDHCPMYCRHCTRSRILGETKQLFNSSTYEEALHYIREHEEVRDVLISGGDPLLLSDHLLEYLLQSLRAIPHVEFLRVGTRVPVTLPQRITPAFVDMLKKYHPLWLSIHCNHPKEITPRVKEACCLLADSGIPVGSQTVLLKGINDDAGIIKSLMHELLKIRVRPYYIYQCDPITGSRHFRASIETGLRIMNQLRGYTSGYAVPTYVLDAPGGGGKIPLNPDYILKKENGKYIFRNYAGEIYFYQDNP